jgi:8-amino-7-oxononanoate synthase
LPQHSIEAILHAYQLLIESDQKEQLQKNIAYFYQKSNGIRHCIKSQSAIHSILVGSNEQADKLEKKLAENNMHVRTMKHPTVKIGGERLRISIHSYNTKEEMDTLLQVLETHSALKLPY